MVAAGTKTRIVCGGSLAWMLVLAASAGTPPSKTYELAPVAKTLGPCPPVTPGGAWLTPLNPEWEAADKQGRTRIEVESGSELRIAPAATNDGWRYARGGAAADTRLGVLWQVPGAPERYAARCPGIATVHFSSWRKPELSAASPTCAGGRGLDRIDVEATIEVTVKRSEQTPASCGLPWDRPGFRIRRFSFQHPFSALQCGSRLESHFSCAMGRTAGPGSARSARRAILIKRSPLARPFRLRSKQWRTESIV